MKDSLFEMLLNLFEKSLARLKENQTAEAKENVEEADGCGPHVAGSQTLLIKSAHEKSMRVFTYDEQMKLTKASYQFLVRMQLAEILSPEMLEIIINQLIFSDSRFVTLQETKWTIRNTLAGQISSEQLAFLDLVLYQKEDELPLH